MKKVVITIHENNVLQWEDMENNIPRLSESDPVYVQTVRVTGDNIQICADVRMHCLCVYM